MKMSGSLLRQMRLLRQHPRRPAAAAARFLPSTLAAPRRSYADAPAPPPRGLYSTTQETPSAIHNVKASVTPQNPQQEAYVRYLASVLHPMVSEISWDDQTSDILLTIYPQYARNVAKVLRDHGRFQYKQLMDVTCVDHPGRAKRFDVVWLYLSVLYQHRLVVRACVDDASGVDSLTPLFHSAVWPEREAWDMFGVYFLGHPDLRRLLTDYGFDGHPLRKDFPLGGYVELVFDAHLGSCRYVSPPIFREEYRDYENIETEWEDLYHRCNHAWAYDRMVENANFQSVDTAFTYDDPTLRKVAPVKLPAHLIRNW